MRRVKTSSQSFLSILIFNLLDSAGTGLGKVSFHSSPKERQCQRMLKLPHSCTYLTCQQHNAQNFPQFVVIYTVKGFSIVNEAEVDVFLEFFFYDPTDVGNLISGPSTFSKSSLNIWKISVYVLLKPSLKNFLQLVFIYTVKGFGIFNKAEVDVFLEVSCFFEDPTDVGNLISGSSAFSKSRLNIWSYHMVQ